MTPQEIIDEARVLINDNNSLMPKRFTDADLLKFVNRALREAAMVRPDLFMDEITFSLTAGSPRQEVSQDVIRIVQVHRITNGEAIVEVDKTTMDQHYPAWTTETAASPVNWMRHPRNPRAFYLYPRPSTGLSVDIEVVEVPEDYALGDTIALSDGYKSALVNCVAYFAEIVDDESAESGRAKFMYDSFLQMLGADMTQRAVVDNDNGQVGSGPRRRTQERQRDDQ